MSGGMERAAIAREVWGEAVEILRSWGEDQAAAVLADKSPYPAPPAPVTVTVDGVTYEQRNDICNGGWWAFETTIWPDEWKGVALTRIAADARRIKELEEQRDWWQSAHESAGQSSVRLLRERDEARRALEAYQNGIGQAATRETVERVERALRGVRGGLGSSHDWMYAQAARAALTAAGFTLEEGA